MGATATFGRYASLSSRQNRPAIAARRTGRRACRQIISASQRRCWGDSPSFPDDQRAAPEKPSLVALLSLPQPWAASWVAGIATCFCADRRVSLRLFLHDNTAPWHHPAASGPPSAIVETEGGGSRAEWLWQMRAIEIKMKHACGRARCPEICSPTPPLTERRFNDSNGCQARTAGWLAGGGGNLTTLNVNENEMRFCF